LSNIDQGDRAPQAQTGPVQPNSWTQEAQNAYTGDKGLAAGLTSRPLTEADLAGASADDIRLTRNTVFAEHGRQFKDHDLQEYFDHQDWYHADPAYKNSDLTPMEKRNVEFLHLYELDHNLNGTRSAFAPTAEVPADTTGLLEPNADNTPLAQSDLDGMSMADLRIARNEILARHGQPFISPDLQERFGNLPWYKPGQNAVPEKSLSWLEDRNIEFIQIQEFDNK